MKSVKWYLPCGLAGCLDENLGSRLMLHSVKLVASVDIDPRYSEGCEKTEEGGPDATEFGEGIDVRSALRLELLDVRCEPSLPAIRFMKGIVLKGRVDERSKVRRDDEGEALHCILIPISLFSTWLKGFRGIRNQTLSRFKGLSLI
jgi:hypothetical protein